MSFASRAAPSSNLSRREALRLLAIAGTGSALGGPVLAGPPTSASGDTDQPASGRTAAGGANAGTSVPDDAMRRREIPSSGEMLPVVGLGTWQQFDVGPSENARAPLKTVLRRMVQHFEQL